MKKVKMNISSWIEEYFDDMEAAVEYIADAEGEEIFDEALDETEDSVEILGYSYSPAEALKRVDPIAYRCAVADYMDSMKENWIEEIEEQIDEEGVAEICGYSLKWVDEEEGGAVA